MSKIGPRAKMNEISKGENVALYCLSWHRVWNYDSKKISTKSKFWRKKTMKNNESIFLSKFEQKYPYILSGNLCKLDWTWGIRRFTICQFAICRFTMVDSPYEPAHHKSICHSRFAIRRARSLVVTRTLIVTRTHTRSPEGLGLVSPAGFD